MMPRSIGAPNKTGPGMGVRRGVYVQHVARFDDETFAEIRAKAVKDGTSTSEAIRQLVEIGLETIKINEGENYA